MSVKRNSRRNSENMKVMAKERKCNKLKRDATFQEMLLKGWMSKVEIITRIRAYFAQYRSGKEEKKTGEILYGAFCRMNVKH